MFIVTISGHIESISYFLTYKDAICFAYKKKDKTIELGDKCVSYTMYPRVVIHEIDINIEYDVDYLLTEQYAIKTFID